MQIRLGAHDELPGERLLGLLASLLAEGEIVVDGLGERLLQLGGRGALECGNSERRDPPLIEGGGCHEEPALASLSKGVRHDPVPPMPRRILPGATAWLDEAPGMPLVLVVDDHAVAPGPLRLVQRAVRLIDGVIRR